MEEKFFQKIKELKDQIESLSLSTRDILTLEEAVTYLQVSKSYLYKLSFKKQIHFISLQENSSILKRMI